MKKFFTTIIALCLCLAISVLAVGCGEQNAYKKFVKKYGSHTAEIKVEEGSLSKEHVSDRYALTGKYEGSTSGSFICRMKEITVSNGAEQGSYDDSSITMEFTVHYYQAKDEIHVYLDRYSLYEGSTTLDKANMDGFKYQFKNGVTLDGESAQDQGELEEKNRFLFDASKYFDDNELSLEDAKQTLTLNKDKISNAPTTNLNDWFTAHETWSDDMLADLLDAVNKTLAEVDKIIEAKMGA